MFARFLHFSRRLDVRIAALVFVLGVSAVLWVVFSAKSNARQLFATTRQAQMQPVLENLESHVRTTLEEMEKVVRDAAGHPLVGDFSIPGESRSAVLRSMLGKQSAIESLAIHREGEMIASTSGKFGEPLKSATLLQASGTRFHVRAVAGEAWSILAAIPAKSEAAPKEWLEATIPPSVMAAALRSSAGENLALLDGRGQVLAQAGSGAMGGRLSKEGAEFIGPAGEEYLGVERRLAFARPIVGDTWRLVALTPKAHVEQLAGSWSGAQLWIGLLAVGLASAIAGGVGHRHRRQLGAMVDFAEKMEEGDFEARLPNQGIAEVQLATRRFNGMARRLESFKAETDAHLKANGEKLDELERWTKGLNAQVLAANESSREGMLFVAPDGSNVVGHNARFFEINRMSKPEFEALEPEQIPQRIAWMFLETEEFLAWWKAGFEAPDHLSPRTWKLRQPEDGVMEVRATPVEHEGKVLALLWRFDDRTEQARIARKAEGVEKAELIGNLASGIGHEFNRIVTGVAADLAQVDGTISPEQWSQIVAKAKSSANQAATISRGLLGFAQENLLEVKINSVHNLLRWAGERMAPDLPPEIELNVALPPKDCHVTGDREKLRTVLLELCTNAVTAMPGGGVLTIAAESFEVGGDELAPDDLEAGRYVCLVVRDTGQGIPETIRENIFEPFFSTHTGCNGLGLSATSGIVWQHGGWIDCESEQGQGTSMRVYLPSSDLPVPMVVEGGEQEVVAKTVSAVPNGAPEAPKTGNFVLVIDDEDMVRRLTQAILKRGGYESVGARNGLEALEICHQHHARISLIVLDLNMPEMTGREFFEALRREIGNVPVIVVSGYLMDFNAFEMSPESGAPPAAFVQKPFQADGFLGHVDGILRAKAA